MFGHFLPCTGHYKRGERGDIEGILFITPGTTHIDGIELRQIHRGAQLQQGIPETR